MGEARGRSKKQGAKKPLAVSNDSPASSQAPHVPGFPSLTLTKVDELLKLVADGNGVKRACLKLGLSRYTFYDALLVDKALRNNYARARDLEGDLDADDVKEIADDPNLSEGEKKIRIDARKWSAGVRRPKLYGQKIEVTELGDPLTPNGIREKSESMRQRIEMLMRRLS